MTLPYRIAVYTDDGQTRLGMVRPEGLLNALSSDPKIQLVAAEVEATTTPIIREAAGCAADGRGPSFQRDRAAALWLQADS